MVTRLVLLLLLLLATATLAAAHRSPAAVRQFILASDHPHGWPGHVVDHQIPLCAGGPDTPANMQWQAAAASYQKDAFERALCVALAREGYILVKRPPMKGSP